MTATLRHRLSVASRIVAGLVGGYGLTSLAIAVLSLCMPGDRAAAMLGFSMVGFFLYAAIIIAVFHARSAVRAWAWIIGACGLLGALLLVLMDGVIVP